MSFHSAEDAEVLRNKVKIPTLVSQTTARLEWGTRFNSLRSESEQVHQVADSRTVQRRIGIGFGGDWVGEIITAASGHRRQMPVGFDELQNRDVIGIGVRDVTGRGER